MLLLQRQCIGSRRTCGRRRLHSTHHQQRQWRVGAKRRGTSDASPDAEQPAARRRGRPRKTEDGGAAAPGAGADAAAAAAGASGVMFAAQQARHEDEAVGTYDEDFSMQTIHDSYAGISSPGGAVNDAWDGEGSDEEGAAGELDEEDLLPPELVPKSPEEAEVLIAQLQWEDKWLRLWERQGVEDAAWAAHHRQAEQGYNMFANTRRVAAIMAQIEQEDYESGNNTTMAWPSWARAELRFDKEFDEFDAHVRANISNMIRKPPPGAEEMEQADNLDEALLGEEFLAPGAGKAAVAKAAAAAAAEAAAGALPGEEHDTVLDDLLTVMPGVTKDFIRSLEYKRLMLEEVDGGLELVDELLSSSDGEADPKLTVETFDEVVEDVYE